MKPNHYTLHPILTLRPVVFAPLLAALFFGALAPDARAVAQFEVIVSLDGSYGSHPSALIEGNDGHLYGTTESGGREGLVFKLNKDGSGSAVLHVFLGLDKGGDGKEPQGLIEASDGVLYGTTRNGGSPGGVLALAGLSSVGNGTVFKLNKDGSGYSVLHRFTGSDGDASEPWAGVVEGPDQALYGTTLGGGSKNLGTVFRLNKDGSGYRVLHSFGVNEGDGVRPFASLLAASDGALYGTTDRTAFKLNSDGGGYRVLHNFPNERSDGRMPKAGLVEGPDGALYGTTTAGGTNLDNGTLFKLNKDGDGYKVLHNFVNTSGQPIADAQLGREVVRDGIRTTLSYERGDGMAPLALVVGRDGAIYGIAEGGKHGGGTLFKLNLDVAGFVVPHSFSLENDGGGPNCLTRGHDGTLYGTTHFGGKHGRGTVFKVSFSSR